MMENGLTVLKMDMESGKERTETHTSVSGRIAKHMGMEFILGPREISKLIHFSFLFSLACIYCSIDMKENGKIDLNMVRELISLLTEMYSQAHTSVGSHMGKENINGPMEVSILEILRTASSMEKEDGKKVKVNKSLYMKETI